MKPATVASIFGGLALLASLSLVTGSDVTVGNTSGVSPFCEATDQQMYKPGSRAAARGECKDCKGCPPGQGRNIDLNVTLRRGVHGDEQCYKCSECPEGFFNDGSDKDESTCRPCNRNCQGDGRVVKIWCNSVSNNVCGACLPGYEDEYGIDDMPCFKRTTTSTSTTTKVQTTPTSTTSLSTTKASSSSSGTSPGTDIAAVNDEQPSMSDEVLSGGNTDRSSPDEGFQQWSPVIISIFAVALIVAAVWFGVWWCRGKNITTPRSCLPYTKRDVSPSVSTAHVVQGTDSEHSSLLSVDGPQTGSSQNSKEDIRAKGDDDGHDTETSSLVASENDNGGDGQQHDVLDIDAVLDTDAPPDVRTSRDGLQGARLEARPSTVPPPENGRLETVVDMGGTDEAPTTLVGGANRPLPGSNNGSLSCDSPPEPETTKQQQNKNLQVNVKVNVEVLGMPVTTLGNAESVTTTSIATSASPTGTMVNTPNVMSPNTIDARGELSTQGRSIIPAREVVPSSTSGPDGLPPDKDYPDEELGENNPYFAVVVSKLKHSAKILWQYLDIPPEILSRIDETCDREREYDEWEVNKRKLKAWLKIDIPPTLCKLCQALDKAGLEYVTTAVMQKYHQEHNGGR